MRLPRRALHLPPKDRAYWRNERFLDLPLLYLAWGERQYGDAPIPVARHDGWICVVVESGAPVLVRDGSCERIPSGSLLVLGSEYASGWEDDVGRSSRLLAWEWREFRHERLQTFPPDIFRRRTIASAEVRRFQALHSMTRDEAREPDADSAGALRGLQDLLEANVARLLEPRGRLRTDDFVNRALGWLDQHIDSRQPLARLADHLGLSPSTVQRLFRTRKGESVRKVVNALRLQQAQCLLARGGISVKEVAYRLGYRHPYDLSRAFRREFGHSPRNMPPDTEHDRAK